MKKLLAILLVAMMLVSFAACGGDDEAKTIELALVTDKGTIDDRSFNQGAWEGLKLYAEENEISYQYYQPTEQSMDAYYNTIKLAVDAGAKLVVCPGYLFENAVHKAQKDFPEVKFIILDGAPHNVTSTGATYDEAAEDRTVAENTYSIFYKEEQAGFLAGYAAVKEGYTKLGFMGGMAVPAVIRFGYGYV
ncbi:MAG: BMP family ABC transporter substrate-binding protein, partial [Anaerofustis stercorihominis]|nr:BMP family ABC transporter substrate-binding protein [Anaerofustis stercorihominis]